MNVTRKPINFEDDRGAICDIFGSDAPDCVTLITSVDGAVRGNHVHRYSTQHAFIVSGRMWAYTRAMGRMIERKMLWPGDLITHEPHEAHAYVAVGEVTFLAFADGVRKGANYEEDTHRLPSLIQAFVDQEHGEAAKP